MAKRPKRRKKANFLKRCRCSMCNSNKYAFKAELRRMNKRIRAYGKGGNKAPQFGIYTD